MKSALGGVHCDGGRKVRGDRTLGGSNKFMQYLVCSFFPCRGDDRLVIPDVGPSFQASLQDDAARDRLIDEAERRRLDQEQREADRNRRQLRTIHVQKKTCRRCIQFAKKILDRYDVSI